MRQVGRGLERQVEVLSFGNLLLLGLRHSKAERCRHFAACGVHIYNL